MEGGDGEGGAGEGYELLLIALSTRSSKGLKGDLMKVAEVRCLKRDGVWEWRPYKITRQSWNSSLGVHLKRTSSLSLSSSSSSPTPPSLTS